MKPKAAIIILNWNGLKDTLECLETVVKSDQSKVGLTTHVVDNASSDNSVAVIKKQFPQIHLIQNSSNLGYSGGNNVGLKAARKKNYDYYILLNNDTTVGKHTFQNLIQQAQKNKFDIASPKIYFTADREFHHQDYQKSERGKVIWYAGGRIDWPNVIAQHVGVNEVDHGQYNQPSLTQSATGCCMLISQKTIDIIGYLDDGFIAYYEDNDYCQRAIKKGFTVGYAPSSIMWHKNAGSTGGSGSARQTKLNIKSRLRFAIKHAPLRAKIALIKHTYFK